MKKLTFSSLALENLRCRRKQYTLMITGILLAMIFSSGITFFISAFIGSVREIKYTAAGEQDAIMFDINADTASELKQNGIISEYGAAQILGRAYTDDAGEEKGFCVAKYDDISFDLAHRRLSEGSLPEKQGEIAVERDALVRMQLANIAVGDTFTVKLLIRNGDAYLTEPVEKTYTLTGILKDQRKYIENSTYKELCDSFPCGVLSREEAVEPGGKTSSAVYMNFTKDAGNGSRELTEYLHSSTNRYDGAELPILKTWRLSVSGIGTFDRLERYSFLFTVLAAALNIAACIGIVNAFTTNLSDRKRQVGLFRALGATKRQIRKIFGREALIISLICVPGSVAVAYFAVKTAIKLMGEEFVFCPKLWTLPLCAAVGVICVMCAAMIPLLGISNVSPMMTVRNTDCNRMMKRKKIRSETQFGVAWLTAKRELVFGKAKIITVSILLTVAILLSSLGFSYVFNITKTVNNSYDYLVYDTYLYGGGYVNRKYNDAVISNATVNELSALPYIDSVKRFEERTAVWIIDEPTEMQYMYLLENQESVGFENAAQIPDINRDNYRDIFFNDKYIMGKSVDLVANESSSKYSVNNSEVLSQTEQLKNRFGYNGYLLPLKISVFPSADIENTDGINIIEGKINIDKINSGEEIIVTVPKQKSFAARVYSTGNAGEYSFLHFYTTDRTEKEIEKSGNKFEREIYLAPVEYDIHAGDEIDVSLLYDNSPAGYEYDESDIFVNTEQHRRTVKIGAIIEEGKAFDGTAAYDLTFITSDRGYESFGVNTTPTSVKLYLKDEPNDETDGAVCALLDSLCSGTNIYYSSTYETEKETAATRAVMLTALSVVIILAFSICTAMINNTMSARVRVSKRRIGTLRAVGASAAELTRSFIYQLLAMFAYGTVGGFILFNLIYFIAAAAAKKIGTVQLLDYSPAIPIILCVVSFAICSLDLWRKVRGEMKNSIIDNIREL